MLKAITFQPSDTTGAYKGASRLATTGALTVTYSNGSSGIGATLTNAGAQAALSIDSVSAVVGDVILIKNQASQLQNGLYTVTSIGSGTTNWILTRSANYNAPQNIFEGSWTNVTEGTVNANTAWQETGAGPFTVGTTAIVFSQMAENGVSALTGTANQILINGGSGTPTTGSITLTLPSTLIAPGTIGNQVLVSAKTNGVGSPYSVLTTDANTYFTNEGASAKVYFNLPTAASNLIYSFFVEDSDGLRVVANTGDSIRVAGTVSGLAGYAESTTIGSSLTLIAINATEWVSFSTNGTWNVV